MLSANTRRFFDEAGDISRFSGNEISELMVKVQEKYNTTSLIISHDMKCIKKTTDRIVILMNGKAYASGTYKELKLLADPLVKQFFQ